MNDKYVVNRMLSGLELGKILCKVFNIDPANVSRLVLDLEADRAAQLKVYRYVRNSEAEELESVLTELAGVVIREPWGKADADPTT